MFASGSGTVMHLLLLLSSGGTEDRHKVSEKDQLQLDMEICPGGLVKQEFTADDRPERWNESCEGSLRIHMIDERHFERETGLRLETTKKGSEEGQNTFVVPDHSRGFVQEPESSKGIPSVAELSQMNRAKARAETPPDATSTGRNLEDHMEGQREESRAKRSVAKVVRYLFR